MNAEELNFSKIFLSIRKGLYTFLKDMSEIYEIVIFTASIPEVIFEFNDQISMQMKSSRLSTKIINLLTMCYIGIIAIKKKIIMLKICQDLIVS